MRDGPGRVLFGAIPVDGEADWRAVDAQTTPVITSATAKAKVWTVDGRQFELDATYLDAPEHDASNVQIVLPGWMDVQRVEVTTPHATFQVPEEVLR